jgi:phage regulator Rha-like protein
LSRSWFRPATALDSYGREQPSFELTRDGFSLLAMGRKGARKAIVEAEDWEGPS